MVHRSVAIVFCHAVLDSGGEVMIDDEDFGFITWKKDLCSRTSHGPLWISWLVLKRN